MKRAFLVVAAAALFAAMSRPACALDPGAAAAIDKATHEWVAAWNAHEPKKMAAVWAEDGDLINPFNRVAKGRAEIEKLFSEEQTGPMKASTYKIDSSTTRQIGTVAVVDWSSTVTGALGPDGKVQPPFPHHVTLLFVKRGGTWMLESARGYVFAGTQPAR